MTNNMLCSSLIFNIQCLNWKIEVSDFQKNERLPKIIKFNYIMKNLRINRGTLQKKNS